MIKVTDPFGPNEPRIFYILKGGRASLLSNTGMDCSEIAQRLFKESGAGSVLTYSAYENKGYKDLAMVAKQINVPAVSSALSGPWGYHTVYALDGSVYTAEVAGYKMNISEYERQLRELNDCEIFKYEEC